MNPLTHESVVCPGFVSSCRSVKHDARPLDTWTTSVAVIV